MGVLKSWAVALFFVGAIALVGCDKEEVQRDDSGGQVQAEQGEGNFRPGEPEVKPEEGAADGGSGEKGEGKNDEGGSFEQGTPEENAGSSGSEGEGQPADPGQKVWRVSASWVNETGEQYALIDLKDLLKTPEQITLDRFKDLVRFSAKSGGETKVVSSDDLKLESLKYSLADERIELKVGYGGSASNVQLDFQKQKWYDRRIQPEQDFIEGIYLIACYNFASNMMGNLFGFRDGGRFRFDRAQDVGKGLQWEDNSMTLSFWVEDSELPEVGSLQLTKSLSGFLPVVNLSKGLKVQASNEMLRFVKWYIGKKNNKIPSATAMENILQNANREGTDLGNLMRTCDYELDGQEMRPAEMGGNKFFELTPEEGLIAHLKRLKFKVEKVEKDGSVPGMLVVSLYLHSIEEERSGVLYVSDGDEGKPIRLELPNVFKP
ncbi:MAG: hypothetical protein CSA97_06060 [Bacteroidetes bacterium]|nr:MAG: hypothetical protein CSA97_06060 [Bacteroidota bacterium]